VSANSKLLPVSRFFRSKWRFIVATLGSDALSLAISSGEVSGKDGVLAMARFSFSSHTDNATVKAPMLAHQRRIHGAGNCPADAVANESQREKSAVEESRSVICPLRA
jgi:hypothetical protein